MSVAETEVPQEPAAEPVEPSEPEPGAEPAAEPVEPEEGDGEPAEPPEPEPGAEPPPEAQRPRDVKEVERMRAKIEAEGARHSNRIEEIVGAEIEEMALCPLCSHGAAGYLGLFELPESALPQLRAMLGMPDLSNLKIATDASMCPDCGGLGSTLTGSLVPGYETKDCARCGKIGWIGPSAAEVAAASANGEPPAITGPQVYGTEPDDPQVASLRERGFTVIPPMAPVAGQ